MIKKFANVILVLTILALAGCGGGGGGDDSGYTGKTSPTALTVSNAPEMSIDVVDGVNSVAALGAIAKNVAGTTAPDNSIQVRALSGTLERSISTMLDKPALAKTVAEAVNGTQSGYSGSFSYSGTADPSTGKFTASFTFHDYMETAYSLWISGSVSVDGYISSQGGGINRLTIVIPSLEIGGGLYGRDSGTFITVKGKMTVVNGVDKTITVSMVFTESGTGKTYWYKDFSIVDSVVTSTINGLEPGFTTINGTFYHPVHGYVMVTTLTPLSDTTNIYGDPVSGQLLFTGSNGSKVLLTYTAYGYVLELDADGTGNYISLIID